MFRVLESHSFQYSVESLVQGGTKPQEDDGEQEPMMCDEPLSFAGERLERNLLSPYNTPMALKIVIENAILRGSQRRRGESFGRLRGSGQRARRSR